ncbi:hypothetical protein [Nesterenkonia halobia]|uniref:Uncharacterized protein n=1 Tax=Nesterenkonia halobia TaxID=37922 RepID=A0ABP6RDW8_9MICC
MSEHLLPAPTTEYEVALFQTGYHFGVSEGVRIGRAELAAEQLAAQYELAARWPFPADQKVKSLRARQARQESYDIGEAA